MTAQEVANGMSGFLNNMCHSKNEFIKVMGNDHRTLQQEFTKLCFKWIEHCASENYCYDGRNEDSHRACKKIVENIGELPYLRFI